MGPHLGRVGEDGVGVGEEAVIVLVVHAVAVGVEHVEACAAAESWRKA